MLLEILLYGSLSGVTSFIVSDLVTRSVINNNKLFQLMDNHHTFLPDDPCNDNATILFIPSVEYLNDNNIKELWYNVDDYNEFKIEFYNTLNEVI